VVLSFIQAIAVIAGLGQKANKENTNSPLLDMQQGRIQDSEVGGAWIENIAQIE
jgi:hypothetical protein